MSLANVCSCEFVTSLTDLHAHSEHTYNYEVISKYKRMSLFFNERLLPPQKQKTITTHCLQIGCWPSIPCTPCERERERGRYEGIVKAQSKESKNDELTLSNGGQRVTDGNEENITESRRQREHRTM